MTVLMEYPDIEESTEGQTSEDEFCLPCWEVMSVAVKGTWNCSISCKCDWTDDFVVCSSCYRQGAFLCAIFRVVDYFRKVQCGCHGRDVRVRFTRRTK